GWYILLSWHVPPDGIFLTPIRCYLMTGAVLAFAAYWGVLVASPLASRLNRFTPQLLDFAAASALGVTVILKPDHMAISLDALFRNLTRLPEWTFAAIFIVGLWAVVMFLPRPPFFTVFSHGIPFALTMIVVLVAARPPYRFSVN